MGNFKSERPVPNVATVSSVISSPNSSGLGATLICDMFGFIDWLFMV